MKVLKHGMLNNKIFLKIIVQRKNIILWTIILFIFGCAAINKSKKSAMKVVKLSVSFPTLTDENAIMTILDSQYIAYEESYIIHKLPRRYIATAEDYDSNGQIMSQKIISNQIKHQYLVYKRGESYGLFYDSIKSKSSRRLKVDSTLRKKLNINESSLYKKTDSIAQVFTIGNTIIEQHIRREKNKDSEADTIYLTFSKVFKEIPYSISHLLDSLKDSKLIKVRNIYNANLSSLSVFDQQRKEIVIELKMELASNHTELQLILKRFKDDIAGTKN